MAYCSGAVLQHERAQPHHSVGQCDEKTARQFTQQIKQSLELSYRMRREAYDRRAWAALNCASWEEYCDEDSGGGMRRLAKELRR